MATKSDFTTDEWKKVLEAPLLASFAISAADPSGLFGLIKEGFASASALAEVKSNPAADALLTAVVDDLLTGDGRSAARDGVKAVATGGDIAGAKDRALTELKSAVAIVNAKAPADAVAFKAWLNHIAQKVAEASAESGFLGFGGAPVSEKEKATLAELATILA
jgi:hypothetical protein